MINGIEVTWTSEQTCQTNEVETNSFTAKVLCDTNITGQGEAEVLIIDNSNECNPIVTLKHDSGCPITRTYVAERLTRYFVLAFAAFAIFCIMVCICCCCCINKRHRANVQK